MVVRLYTIDQAAKKLHVAEYTMREYVRLGRISHARVGRRLLFSEEHLQESVRSRTTPARSNGNAS